MTERTVLASIEQLTPLIGFEIVCQFHLHTLGVQA